MPSRHIGLMADLMRRQGDIAAQRVLVEGQGRGRRRFRRGLEGVGVALSNLGLGLSKAKEAAAYERKVDDEIAARQETVERARTFQTVMQATSGNHALAARRFDEMGLTDFATKARDAQTTALNTATAVTTRQNAFAREVVDRMPPDTTAENYAVVAPHLRARGVDAGLPQEVIDNFLPEQFNPSKIPAALDHFNTEEARLAGVERQAQSAKALLEETSGKRESVLGLATVVLRDSTSYSDAREDLSGTVTNSEVLDEAIQYIDALEKSGAPFEPQTFHERFARMAGVDAAPDHLKPRTGTQTVGMRDGEPYIGTHYGDGTVELSDIRARPPAGRDKPLTEDQRRRIKLSIGDRIRDVDEQITEAQSEITMAAEDATFDAGPLQQRLQQLQQHREGLIEERQANQEPLKIRIKGDQTVYELRPGDPQYEAALRGIDAGTHERVR